MSKRRSQQCRIAVHEAGHAVVAHLTGTAIDHVKIRPNGSGYSMPVRDPVDAAADKLWDEASAIGRRLVWDYQGGEWRGGRWSGGKHVYVLRKGYRRLKNGDVRGTPAPELVARRDALRKRARAMWKKSAAETSKDEWAKELMHTLGGPVADAVFFNIPFEAPRGRLLSKAKIKARGLPEGLYGYAGESVGNSAAGGDFRSIRRVLKHIDDANWKETREVYRRKVERLVRKHRETIERVAQALVRRKTLTGAEVAKLVEGES
jgi:hypothetical protein